MIDKNRINNTHKQFHDSCLLSNYAVACNYFTRIEVENYFMDYLKEFEDDFMNLTIFHNPKNNQYIRDNIGDYNRFQIDIKNMKNHFLCVAHKNFDLTETIEFLRIYSTIIVFHLHTICVSSGCNFTKNNIPGLEFIQKFHSYSEQINISNSREIIDTQLYNFKNENNKMQLNDEINDELHNKECVINVFTNHSNNGFLNMHSYTIYKDIKTKKIYIHDTNRPDRDSEVSEKWISNFESGQILKYLPK